MLFKSLQQASGRPSDFRNDTFELYFRNSFSKCNPVIFMN